MEPLTREQQIWHETLEQLRTSIDPVVFTTWFRGTIALSWQEEVFVVSTPTTFTKTYLEVRYLDQMSSTLSAVVGTPLRVQLTVARNLLPMPPDERWYESDTTTFLMVITKEGSNYQASMPDLPGCMAIGKTRAEAAQGVREAFQAYLEMSDNDQTSIPEPQTTAEYIHLPYSLNQEQSDLYTLQEKATTTLSCSFCKKPQDQVARLTWGPGRVSICNECVDYCREMIENGAVDFQQIRQALASRQ